jgi:CDP-diacylglycerol--glycerol-3-phosphate 3-phosphatidyltransferase
MRTRVPADSLVGRVILSTRFQPGALVGVGLIASLFVPFCALVGGPVILVCLPLIGIGALTEASYALIAARSTSLSRRILVFEPLAARMSEAAWLLALWILGAPGWAVTVTGALCWMYVITRSRARQVGLNDLGMITLGERSVREIVVALGFGAAGVIAVAGGGQYEQWIGGAVTVAVTAWMLMATLGLLQLVIVVSAALRND